MMSDREDAVAQGYLKQAAALPTYQAADWDRLATRIVERAEPLLAARRPRPTWREEVVRLGRVALPIALAASLAALAVWRQAEVSATRESLPGAAFLSAMAGETSRETVLDLTLGESEPGLLLADGR
jgi:hypothetical protein